MSKLYGYRLALIRGAWVVIAFLALVVFISGLPQSVRDALRISEATHLALAQVGLSARFPAYFYLTNDILTFVSFGGIALVLAWRRSDDWAVLFIALMLLLTGLLYTDPPWNSPLPVWIPATLFGLAEIGQVGFFFLFPDGRFIPRWSA